MGLHCLSDTGHRGQASARRTLIFHHVDRMRHRATDYRPSQQFTEYSPNHRYVAGNNGFGEI
jgi:hypothetical protein